MKQIETDLESVFLVPKSRRAYLESKVKAQFGPVPVWIAQNARLRLMPPKLHTFNVDEVWAVVGMDWVVQ